MKALSKASSFGKHNWSEWVDLVDPFGRYANSDFVACMFFAHSVFIAAVMVDTTISGFSALKSKNTQYCAFNDRVPKTNNAKK